MGKNLEIEFLQEKLAHSQAEAESYHLQADTALRFAEQVWWSWDLQAKRIHVRSVGECILGYGPEDADRPEAIWWERIHPEDLSEVERSLETVFRGDREIWHCEHRMRDVQGDWAWVEQSGFVLRRDPEGNPAEMVGTMRKTQERYQLLDLFRGAESIIEALVDNAPVCFWLRDQKGRVLLISDSMKRRFGCSKLDSREELLCDEDTLTEWRQAFAAAMEGEYLESNRLLREAGGRKRAYLHHLIPVAAGHEPYAVLEIFLRPVA